jgi:SAM-dependent methyltransferase
VDRETLHFYESRGREWSASHPAGSYGTELDDFLDMLPPGAMVLELGCGDGRDAEHMIARGFAVFPSDGSPGMAALASERLGRAVPVMRFTELEAADAFDAAWCQSSLLHVGEIELPGVLARVHRALRPGGWHWASYKGGHGGGRDEFGRFFSYLPRTRLETIYSAAAKWTDLVIVSGEGHSFGGAPTPWHNVLARK